MNPNTIQYLVIPADGLFSFQNGQGGNYLRIRPADRNLVESVSPSALVSELNALSPLRMLAVNGVQSIAPANTSENTLGSVTVPGGAMGANGALFIWATFSITENANNKTLRFRFGGTEFLNVVLTNVPGTTMNRVIYNRNSETSQVSHALSGSGFGNFATGTAPVTASVNTAVNQNLTITGQKASAGDTIALESFLVALMRVS